MLLDAYSNSEPIFNERRHLRLTYLAARAFCVVYHSLRQLNANCWGVTALISALNGLSLRGGEARRATIAILSFERPISRVVYDAVLNAPIEGEAPSPVGPSRAWISEFMAALIAL